MSNHFHRERGFVGLYLTIVVLILMLGIITSIGFGVLTQQRIMQNTVQSAQAYATSESGVEDALLRLKNGMAWSSPYSITAATSSIASITISPISGGARTITVEGDALDRTRTTQIVYELSSTGVGFFYGAQVGDLGVEMENNSQIVGNVFSNGDFELENNALITGTVQISGNGNRLSEGEIGGDAYVDTCNNTDIIGILYALSETGCSYTSFVNQPPPAPIPLPISPSTIVDWKNEATAGTVISGNYQRSGGVNSLGPAKIEGNMTIENDAQLVITGTIWVTGDVIVKGNSQVRLDLGYDTTSGALIADGRITLENNSISSGSGQAGSYLMYLSDSSLDPALIIKNNAQVDILYTSNGFVQVENNAAMREIVGYGLEVKNNAVVTYEIGLASSIFTNGPGGGWRVTSWKEIE
ncbi:MAG: hypothetical protein HYT49_03365 [Candidatus Wildermuthbacteria bacterium]|nr:hypothetical protein [Candidatus Wildermuthbacteria bacterium]